MTGHGNPAWRATHESAEQTALAVQACLDAGAGVRGITHMDELAFSLNGENKHYGMPLVLVQRSISGPACDHCCMCMQAHLATLPVPTGYLVARHQAQQWLWLPGTSTLPWAATLAVRLAAATARSCAAVCGACLLLGVSTL